jgi:hypothetical protein
MVRQVTLAPATVACTGELAAQRRGAADRAGPLGDRRLRPAGLLKRKLSLAKDNDHPAHAVWFRMHRTASRIDNWSDRPAWRAAATRPRAGCPPTTWSGAGYWVWLIPLSSGSHSVGIVADPAGTR